MNTKIYETPLIVEFTMLSEGLLCRSGEILPGGNENYGGWGDFDEDIF